MIDADGYCRECRTKHGSWGHLPETGIVAVEMQADVDRYLKHLAS